MDNNQITHEGAANNFYSQIQYSLENYKKHNLKLNDFSNVVICGLGGSGIGGKLAKTYFTDISSIPIEVVSGYSLPAYVNERSLVIVSSYSGDTEETISLIEQISPLNATCLAMSTGGKIESISKDMDYYFLSIKKGYQPRMALGFSLSYLFLILSELFNLNLENELQGTVNNLKDNSSNYESKGKEILDYFENQLQNKFIFISGESLSSVSLRACQQMEENAKHEAFYHTLPECNHNVTESYYGKLPSNFVFLEGWNHDRTNHRITFLRDLIKKYGNKVYSLSLTEKSVTGIFEMILTLDWLSIHLSNSKKVNNMEVPNIMDLKNFLSNIK